MHISIIKYQRLNSIHVNLQFIDKKTSHYTEYLEFWILSWLDLNPAMVPFLLGGAVGFSHCDFFFLSRLTILDDWFPSHFH